MDQITTNSIIERNDDIIQAEIDGEIVMMSVDNGEYYGLDTVASRIWEMIEAPLSVSAICEQLVGEYDVTEETCLNDVLGFLKDMFENKVILIKA